MHVVGAVFAAVYVDRSGECITNKLKFDSRFSTSVKDKICEGLYVMITFENELSISLILAIYWSNTIKPI